MLHYSQEDHISFIEENLHGGHHNKELHPFCYGNGNGNGNDNNNNVKGNNDITDNFFHAIGDRTNDLVDELRTFTFTSSMIRDIIARLMDTNCERHLALVRAKIT